MKRSADVGDIPFIFIAFPYIFESLPGAGAALAPRLLAALGS
jgi:hypothetical protein